MLRIFIKLLLSFAVGFLIGCTLLQKASMIQTRNMPLFDMSDFDTNLLTQKMGILGLYREEEFHCTAVVISHTLALTAAHCLVDSEYFMLKKPFVVKDKDFAVSGTANPVAVNTQADLGLVSGDFSTFRKFKLNLKGFLGSAGPYVTCGFPWGDEGICTPFAPAANYYAEVMGKGTIFPGMSGGPVIDVSTEEVVGINTEVNEGFIVVTPLTGVLAALHMKVLEAHK
jgi:hypothetical protein